MPDNYGKANDWGRASYYDIHEWNLDKTVTPHTMVRGVMGKDTGATPAWRYLRVSSSGAVSNDDAANFLVSAKSGDGGLFRISALQGDAGSLRASAFQGDAGLLRASALQGDAGLFRISSIQSDAGNLRTSAFVDSGSVSAKSSDAGNALVSAKQGDAGLLRISALQGDAGLFRISAIGTLTVSSHEVKQSDAASLRVSSIIDNGSVSAKSSDAANLLISAKQGDAGFLRVSGVQGDANTFHVSAVQGDGALHRVSGLSPDAANFRISAVQGDANNQHVSAVQGDANLAHVSSFPNFSYTFFTSAFDIGTTGGVAVVNGASSKKIYVYGVNLTLNASGGIKWQTGSTDLQGVTRLSASAGYIAFVPPPAYVIATTSAGQDLNLALSAASVSASGWVAGWSQ